MTHGDTPFSLSWKRNKTPAGDIEKKGKKERKGDDPFSLAVRRLAANKILWRNHPSSRSLWQRFAEPCGRIHLKSFLNKYGANGC